MTDTIRTPLDRPDRDPVRRQTPEHVDVETRLRGALEQGRDSSQHRRFTALYDDLQN